MSEKEEEPKVLETIIEEPNHHKAEATKEAKEETKPKKEKKKRKPMTPEHKAKVMAGLAKARAASALARAKRSEVKKIKKADENEERDEIIRKDLLKKTAKSDEKDKRILALEKKLASLTLQDVIKKPKAKKIKVIDDDYEEEETSPYTLENPEPPKKVYEKPPAQPAQPAQETVAKPETIAPVKIQNEIKKAVYRGRGRKR
tara:strand:- start:691 stop:1296 length:606 start_codon:yes stop_codon:yes gene_type:complete